MFICAKYTHSMRIGIVCYPTFGGSGVLATELGKALADKGHQVHFITYQQPVRLNEFNANIFYHEVRVTTYPLFDYPPMRPRYPAPWSTSSSITSSTCCMSTMPSPTPRPPTWPKRSWRPRAAGIPVITTLHGTDITLVGRDKTFAPVVAFSINQSDAITAVSENLRRTKPTDLPTSKKRSASSITS
jgi:hypothetical protein